MAALATLLMHLLLPELLPEQIPSSCRGGRVSQPHVLILVLPPRVMTKVGSPKREAKHVITSIRA